MVVGPPGTGKTDVAVQILSNWYHALPNTRTLMLAHSNQALNALFDKIAALDMDERHLIRIGHGEGLLETTKDFSKWGRVDHLLKLRQDRLKDVEKLAVSLGLPPNQHAHHTAETSAIFFRTEVLPRWRLFCRKIDSAIEKGAPAVSIVAEEFPFSLYFAEVHPLFKTESVSDDYTQAKSCFRLIQTIFDDLKDSKPFEVMRTQHHRTQCLLTGLTKVVAMTFTHAGMSRENIAKLCIGFDNIIMEEGGQVLDIETFIPLLLEKPKTGTSSLKRLVMIGDHNQLPPVVQNLALQKHACLGQSCFARLVKLGVPYHLLDAQGRSRPEIAALYNWRYPGLGNLPHVHVGDYEHANPGLCHSFQAINVEDYNGRGETQPTPYFYQNAGEAEYCVALYQYLRLIGYPAERISIITTYNGQKSLLKNVVSRRCAHNPLFGFPHRIATVDEYQGQQNDIVILSLVRTRNIGHLRDVRRLVVALSRSRFGLYVFCRTKLFETCLELSPAFKQLLSRPTELQIAPGEIYDTKRKTSEVVIPRVIPDVESMGKMVFDMTNQAAAAASEVTAE
eukprot:TRINITY_DN9930_c0_g1_i1.p1 TRINITY_DN9930_c0_g1~~TRINITY_DN9930_c0_g1_i1.p1  ORF type:complete len:621 (+),score=189.18 TRINITY_DN9930_c0_g1_i1:176-1864(+)